MRMPTICTASTICASVNRLMRRAIPLYADATTLAEIAPALRLCLRAADPEPGRFLQAGARAARDRRPVRGRRDSGRAVRAGSRLQHDARFPHRRLRAIRPMSSSSTRRPSPRSPASSCGSSIACGASRIRRTAISPRRWPGSRGCKPRRAVLTHMDQSLDYASSAPQLPAGVEPGYDGLVIEL